MIMRVSSPLHPGMPCAGFLLDVFFFHKPFLGLNRFQILKSSPMLIYPKGHFFVFVYLFVCIFISHYSSSTVSQYQLWARFNECL